MVTKGGKSPILRTLDPTFSPGDKWCSRNTWILEELFMWKIHQKPRHHKQKQSFVFKKNTKNTNRAKCTSFGPFKMSTRFFESPNLQRKLWKYLVIYWTVLFFLVSQKRPTFFGSILATLLVSATTTIDICCATFFCTKNREFSRRREFSVPDSRTKTGRDVSLLAKLSLFYLSLGSKKISGFFGGSIGTTPWKFKAFEPKKSPDWNPEHGLPNLPCLWVEPPFNFPGWTRTKNHHFSWP